MCIQNSLHVWYFKYSTCVCRNAKIPVAVCSNLLHIFAHLTFCFYLFMGCWTVWFKGMRNYGIWELVGARIFPLLLSSPVTHTHTVSYPCDWLEWLCQYRNSTPVPPPSPPCAMKLIIAIEIIDSHSNLDIFRGVGMMIRLYSKWDITLFPPSFSLSFLFLPLSFIFSPHLGVLFCPRLYAFIFIV